MSCILKFTHIKLSQVLNFLYTLCIEILYSLSMFYYKTINKKSYNTKLPLKLINSYSSTLSLKSHKTVKPIYKSNFNNIHYSQAKYVTITI